MRNKSRLIVNFLASCLANSECPKAIYWEDAEKFIIGIPRYHERNKKRTKDSKEFYLNYFNFKKRNPKEIPPEDWKLKRNFHSAMKQAAKSGKYLIWPKDHNQKNNENIEYYQLTDLGISEVNEYMKTPFEFRFRGFHSEASSDTSVSSPASQTTSSPASQTTLIFKQASSNNFISSSESHRFFSQVSSDTSISSSKSVGRSHDDINVELIKEENIKKEYIEKENIKTDEKKQNFEEEIESNEVSIDVSTLNEYENCLFELGIEVEKARNKKEEPPKKLLRLKESKQFTQVQVKVENENNSHVVLNVDELLNTNRENKEYEQEYQHVS